MQTIAPIFAKNRKFLVKPFNVKIEHLNPTQFQEFRKSDLEYWQSPELFINWINNLPDLDHILEQIQLKKTNFKNRSQLVDMLQQQYSGFSDTDPIFTQIKSLAANNTFTILCAHQPCLLGGPLFWWYKIANTIKLASILKNKFPEYSFVPIYYSGNEDHDFEEVNHFSVFQQNIQWVSEETGAVGRFKTDGLKSVFETLKNLFGNDPESLQIINQFALQAADCKTYKDFYRHFVHQIFGAHGLIYFDPDDASAKSLIKDILKAECLDQLIVKQTEQTIQELTKINYPIQAAPRPINLFYLKDQYRERLLFEHDLYVTVDSKYKWTQEELMKEIDHHPEYFSPNVLVRPLYQETLFPNIMFVGGGAEISYWMELKQVFKSMNLTYPLLHRRISGWIIPANIQSKINKSILKYSDFTQSAIAIEKQYLESTSTLPSAIKNVENDLHKVLQQYAILSNTINDSTHASTLAEIARIEKQTEGLKHKILKAEKQKFDEQLQKIIKIKEQLFPNSGLQERNQSGIQYYLQYGKSFIDELIDAIEFNNKEVIVFLED